jgi:hypothetical protein
MMCRQGQLVAFGGLPESSQWREQGNESDIHVVEKPYRAAAIRVPWFIQKGGSAMKITAFNVENLFDRPKAFNEDDPALTQETIKAVAGSS